MWTRSSAAWVQTLRAQAIVLLALWASLPCAAAESRVVVFDLELVDTSLQGAMRGPRADEQARIAEVSNMLRRRIADHAGFHLVDVAPVATEAAAMHLQACGGCDADLARRVGAQVSITGTVQKVSNLILNMNIYLKDTMSGRLVAVGADFRGNTDESWSRALDWIVRNRLFPALDRMRE
jgi:hypothetical protein